MTKHRVLSFCAIMTGFRFVLVAPTWFICFGELLLRRMVVIAE